MAARCARIFIHAPECAYATSVVYGVRANPGKRASWIQLMPNSLTFESKHVDQKTVPNK